jgi:hypothetical protein
LATAVKRVPSSTEAVSVSTDAWPGALSPQIVSGVAAFAVVADQAAAVVAISIRAVASATRTLLALGLTGRSRKLTGLPLLMRDLGRQQMDGAGVLQGGWN